MSDSPDDNIRKKNWRDDELAKGLKIIHAQRKRIEELEAAGRPGVGWDTVNILWECIERVHAYAPMPSLAAAQAMVNRNAGFLLDELKHFVTKKGSDTLQNEQPPAPAQGEGERTCDRCHEEIDYIVCGKCREKMPSIALSPLLAKLQHLLHEACGDCADEVISKALDHLHHIRIEADRLIAQEQHPFDDNCEHMIPKACSECLVGEGPTQGVVEYIQTLIPQLREQADALPAGHNAKHLYALEWLEGALEHNGIEVGSCEKANERVKKLKELEKEP